MVSENTSSVKRIALAVVGLCLAAVSFTKLVKPSIIAAPTTSGGGGSSSSSSQTRIRSGINVNVSDILASSAGRTLQDLDLTEGYRVSHTIQSRQGDEQQSFQYVEALTCPDVFEEPLGFFIVQGSHSLLVNLPPPDRLCTLVKLIDNPYGDQQLMVPLARAYNGHGWELFAGKYSHHLPPVECFDGTGFCQLRLGSGDIQKELNSGTFQLTSKEIPPYNTKDKIARFLEQTTFGPTMTAIKEIEQQSTSDDDLDILFSDWVMEQQVVVPVGSHRAKFRERANAQWEIPYYVSALTKPCNKGSRYRRGAFSMSDFGKTMEIRRFGPFNKRAIYVDGRLRTILDGETYTWGVDSLQVEQKNWPAGFYKICNWYTFDKNWRGVLQVEDPDDSEECIPFLSGAGGNKVYSNPPINWKREDLIVLDQFSIFRTYQVEPGSAQPIDQQYVDDETANNPKSAYPDDPQIILLEDLDYYNGEPFCAAAEGYTVPWIVEWDGKQYIFDSRISLIDNTIDDPAEDGGGTVFRASTDFFSPPYAPMCSNAPRTFLNEDTCRISSVPNVCHNHWSGFFYYDRRVNFAVTPENLVAINDATRADANVETLYMYAIDGLDINRDPDVTPPCQPGAFSSWVPISCDTATSKNLPESSATNQYFAYKLSNAETENVYVTEVRHQFDRSRCDPSDATAVGFEVQDAETGRCWRNVHPDHLNVYDFSPWVSKHPGGPAAIQQFADRRSSTLVFPDWHELYRWQNNKDALVPRTLRLGSTMNYFDLPKRIRTETVARALGILDQVSTGDSATERAYVPSVVCGSPNEVANDPFSGGSFREGAFQPSVNDRLMRPFPLFEIEEQREVVWLMMALQDPGQFRQRVAWALSQILTVTPSAVDGNLGQSEAFLAYYDIFIRNAFGNYGQILKEVSYSPIMGSMLTYRGGRATATVLEREGVLQFADENYAREIMQLFTIGLVQLHRNGTQVLDTAGRTVPVYTNDDIEEYARAWTGFTQNHQRGNMEQYGNMIDPMQIIERDRDRLPKMGLDGTYVGDFYPLCSDLPTRHFLLKGATYRVLGGLDYPELVRNPSIWIEPDSLRVTLETSSDLYRKLCAPGADGDCDFKSKVVLDETISCFGGECLVDTVRTVEVAGVFYEYVRPRCVNEAFYTNAKTIMHRNHGDDAMCADPRVEAASVGCCHDSEEVYQSFWVEQYYGERTLFSTASNRCDEMFCPPSQRPSCGFARCQGEEHIWAATSCTIKAKVDTETGKVAIVHEPEDVLDEDIASIVKPHTATFFRVNWEGGYQRGLLDCENIDTCSITDDGKCLCEVEVSEEQVFVGSATPNKEDVLSSLHVGSFEPAGPPHSTINEVSTYRRDSDGSFTRDSVFEVTDYAGVRHYRRNIKLTVRVTGTSLVFRNPVHFLSLHDPEVRDAQFETDAVLDHLLYHKNAAPFLAIRFAQRFGLSNPTPRYVEAIADAFVTGKYFFQKNGRIMGYGGGKYGDLAATFAAVILDREARDVILDVDPMSGSLKEPLIKVVSLMRSLEFTLNNPYAWAAFRDEFGAAIGQMAHQIPNVFSFFLPEYQPSGLISRGSLVSPESQVMTGPRLVDTMNGIYSFIKYGLTMCFSGFGPWDRGTLSCQDLSLGDKKGRGGFSYQPESTGTDIVDELATLMTAGRLHPEARSYIKEVISRQDEHALTKAQMLIATAPDFHTTNIVRFRRYKQRELKPEPTPSAKPYKALVYVFLGGGMDSYNLLVPHKCDGENGAGQTVRMQYAAERRTVAFTESERNRIIEAEDQPCSEFAIHPDFPLAERLYKDGDLSFFANVGQLDVPVTKNDYYVKTKTGLFAHNLMQEVYQKQDPWATASGSGVMGRMSDRLLAKGFKAQAITLKEASAATSGFRGAGVDPLIFPTTGVSTFGPTKKNEEFDMNDHVAALNNHTFMHSSVFGETFSSKLWRGMDDANLLRRTIDGITLDQTYPVFIEGDNDYGRKARTLSEAVLTHEKRGVDRDLIFLTLDDWDHHNTMKPSLATNFKKLNKVLELFEKEMKAHGLWDQVAVVIGSDFGRTLTPNAGSGTDHAWGGNYLMFGGDVDGGKIFGDYPTDLTENGPLNLGRGRLIPTLSWESMLTSGVEWMDLDTDDELDVVFPNRAGSGTRMFSRSEVFKN